MSRIYFATDSHREETIELYAKSKQYYDFEDNLTPKGVIGTLMHFGYDSLFALEVTYRMKQYGRFK